MSEISLSFEPRTVGGHVHVKVRAGQAGSRGLCGDLTMRPDEWELLARLVQCGLEHPENTNDEHPVAVFNPDGWTPGGTSRTLEQFEELRDAATEVLRWDHDADALPADLYIALAVAVDDEPDRARAVAEDWKALCAQRDAEHAAANPPLPIGPPPTMPRFHPKDVDY